MGPHFVGIAHYGCLERRPILWGEWLKACPLHDYRLKRTIHANVVSSEQPVDVVMLKLYAADGGGGKCEAAEGVGVSLYRHALNMVMQAVVVIEIAVADK